MLKLGNAIPKQLSKQQNQNRQNLLKIELVKVITKIEKQKNKHDPTNKVTSLIS